MRSLTPVPLKVTIKQQKILDVANRICKLNAKYLCAKEHIGFSRFTGKYGYCNVVCGDIPEQVKSEARMWLQYANNVCKSVGVDTSSMFADEIFHIVFEVEHTRHTKLHNIFEKASRKVKNAANNHQVSALEFDTVLVGDTFIPRYLWHGHNILFTQSDKEKLAYTKEYTIDALLHQIRVMPYVNWFFGDDYESECSSEVEFLKFSKLSVWVEFRPTVMYYNNNIVDLGESSICSSEPKCGDDTRLWTCRISLYHNFNQDTDHGYPSDYISFTVNSETLL